MRGQRRLGDLRNTSSSFLQVADSTTLTSLSGVAGGTRALVLLINLATILADQRNVTERPSEADVAQAEPLHSAGWYSVVAGAHVAEQPGPLRVAFALAIHQFPFFGLTICDLLAALAGQAERAVASDLSVDGVSSTSVQTPVLLALLALVPQSAHAFPIDQHTTVSAVISRQWQILQSFLSEACNDEQWNDVDVISHLNGGI